MKYTDETHMRRALTLAERGAGFVNPNPMVGAVIVKEGRVISEGWHEQYGANHAERNAFQRACEDVSGADMYVSLEPCSHHGKTPPCAEAIMERGIKRVFIAAVDPNPLVSGRGIKLLRDHGVEVITGVLEEESRKLNRVFLKYITTKTPFCLMKYAMTLDGKIAAHTGDSRWVTGSEARRHVHQTRHRLMGIMTGIGTVLADDPVLTTRLDGSGSLRDGISSDGRADGSGGSDSSDFQPLSPVKIICDTSLRIPLTAKVLQKDRDAVYRSSTASHVIIACGEEACQEKEEKLLALGAQVLRLPRGDGGRLDLRALMAALGEQGMDSVLLEGGGNLNFSALQAGIVDRAHVYVAPKVIGGKESKTPVEGEGLSRMAEALPFSIETVKQLGQDLLLECLPFEDRK